MACSADRPARIGPLTLTEPTRRAVMGAGVGLGLAALTGCGGDRPPPVEPPRPLESYVIGIGDRIRVEVLEHDQLSVEADVADDGMVEVPLVGQVRAAGRTAPELRQQLTARLGRDFIINPRVNVEVSEYRPFYVLGEVNRPGSYPFVPDLDIRKAVAVAGGFTRRADTGFAYLVRETGEDRSRIEVSLNTRVFPGDVIEIDRRLF